MKLKFHNNRSHNLTEYLTRFGWEEVEKEQQSDFSLWDTYGKEDIVSKIKVWPKEFYSMIDCLWTWHTRLEKNNLTQLAPRTITDWEKDKLTPDDFKNGEIWFFKQIFGVHGKGINLFSTYKEYQEIDNYIQKASSMQGPCLQEDLKHHYILQQGIVDTNLIQGRKYILRVYTLTLGNGSTYLYNDCFYYSALFPKKYDNKDCYIGENNKVYPLNVKNKSNKTFVPAKQMRTNVHVSHWHQQREGQYNIVDNRIMGVLSDLPIYKQVMNNLFRNAREMSKLQTEVLDEYSKCKEKPININLSNIYQIWGSDYIVEENLDVKCLEINAFPNLSHGDPYKGKAGSKKRPHEIKFRKNGFDRDLMRRLGFNLENTDKPNNWVLVNKENLSMNAEDMLLQKQTGQKTKRKKNKRRKTRKRSRRTRRR